MVTGGGGRGESHTSGSPCVGTFGTQGPWGGGAGGETKHRGGGGGGGDRGVQKEKEG